MRYRTPMRQVFFSLLLGALLELLGCQQEVVRLSDPRPKVEPTPLPRPVQMVYPSPTSTKSLEELKYDRDLVPTATPPPLAVTGFGTEPYFLSTSDENYRGQLSVHLNKIIYEKISPEDVRFLLDGRLAKGIQLSSVELFEAQDILINFLVTPEALPGRYDARVRVGKESFFLEGVFEVLAVP